MWVLVPSMICLSESSGQLDKADIFFLFFLLLNADFISENSGGTAPKEERGDEKDSSLKDTGHPATV